jgi:hypothetical protein
MLKTLILAAAAASIATGACAESLLNTLARQAAQTTIDRAVSGASLPSGLSSGPVASSASADGASGYQRYGAWDFRLEGLETGPDGQWQAVIGVRNAANYRQGMVVSEIKAFLITADGETLTNWGELYKASVGGNSAGLETVAGTLWLEPGDETRVRLRWDGSRGLKPAKLRLQSTGATSATRTFSVAAG